MQRVLLVAAAVAPLIAGGCSPSFKDRRTPSGEFCTDMSVLPAGQEPDREYHRLQPITSDPKARTEAERLESLRKAACNVGGDAVIEAVNEEIRGENAAYLTVSSGTAVIWLRPSGDVKPIIGSGGKKPAPGASADAGASGSGPLEVPTSEPSATPSATPSASASAKPAASGSAKPAASSVKPAASAKPAAGAGKKKSP